MQETCPLFARLVSAAILVAGPAAAAVQDDAAPAAAATMPVEVAARGKGCPEGRVADIEPREAIVARLRGKDARIFIESCLESGPTGRTPEFDQALVLSGPNVMGGVVGIIAHGDCVVGHKFLGLVEFVHAGHMVRLFERHPALQSVEHLDLDVLTTLAEGGEPAAEFHVGFVKAMGWGTAQDRPGSIDWFRRAALHGFEPGMLALGMSLAGPGVIDEQNLPVGEQRPRDAQTDFVQACYWLRRLGSTQGGLSEIAETLYREELAPRMTSDEEASCRVLLEQSPTH